MAGVAVGGLSRSGKHGGGRSIERAKARKPAVNGGAGGRYALLPAITVLQRRYQRWWLALGTGGVPVPHCHCGRRVGMENKR